MTEAEAKNRLVAWALGQVGYRESGDNWNRYAPEWAAAGGWNAQGQPWCDVFVDVGFIHCFGVQKAARMTFQPVGGFSALCSASANYYKANGAFFSTPQIGDQAFFNVSGGINHTGIVVGVNGALVTCVEGNSSDAVRKNSYPITSSYVAGFGRPDWSVAADPSEPKEEPKPEEPKEKLCTVTVSLPVIEYGAASMYVRLMQTALIGRGFNCGWYGADGEYGQQTKIALFEFQKKSGLETDNICGPATWAALLEVKT